MEVYNSIFIINIKLNKSFLLSMCKSMCFTIVMILVGKEEY